MATHIVHIDVDPGDPHNDQLYAEATRELDWHIGSTKNAFKDGDKAVEVTAGLAHVLMGEDKRYPRERLVSMLAAALVRMARPADEKEDEFEYELGDLVKKTGGDYSFNGFVVARFHKMGATGSLDGPKRYVVQDGRGVLLIMNEQQVHLAPGS